MIYWNGATIACMQTVRELQSQGVPVFFTIDAGPQLKAICAQQHETTVRDALAATEGVTDVMLSGIGTGAIAAAILSRRSASWRNRLNLRRIMLMHIVLSVRFIFG